jgi:hypothetical protein
MKTGIFIAILWHLELLAECPDGKNPDPIFLKMSISLVNLVEFWYFGPFPLAKKTAWRYYPN